VTVDNEDTTRGLYSVAIKGVDCTSHQLLKNTERAKIVLLRLDTVRDSLQRNPTSKHSREDW